MALLVELGAPLALGLRRVGQVFALALSSMHLGGPAEHTDAQDVFDDEPSHSPTSRVDT